jgi:hypothetical protein
MLHHPRVLCLRQVRSGPKPLSHAPEAITAPSAYPADGRQKALARENQGNLAPVKTGAVFFYFQIVSVLSPHHSGLHNTCPHGRNQKANMRQNTSYTTNFVVY